MIKILALLLLLPTLAWAGPEMLLMLTNGSGTVSGGGGGGAINDHFDSDTSANYTAINGGITVGSGVASGSTAWAKNLLYHNTSLSSADQDVSVLANYNGTSDGGGAIARVDTGASPVTGYAAYFSATGTIGLYSFSGTTFTYITNYNGSYASGTHTVRLTTSGTTIKVYVDSVERISTTNSTYTIGNNCGVYLKRDAANYAATVDDFTASAL